MFYKTPVPFGPGVFLCIEAADLLSCSSVIPECSSRESVFVAFVLFQNDRSPTETFGDDGFMKKEVILNLVQDLPIVLLVFCIVVVVILESRSLGSVVIKKGKQRILERSAPANLPV